MVKTIKKPENTLPEEEREPEKDSGTIETEKKIYSLGMKGFLAIIALSGLLFFLWLFNFII